MPGAEMTIRLVDASPEEQAAFDTPMPVQTKTTPPPDPQSAPVSDKKGSNPQPGSEAKTAGTDDAMSVSTAMQELSGKLTPELMANPIDRLIDALKPGQTGSTNQKQEPVPPVGLIEPKPKQVDAASVGLDQVLDRMQRRLGTSVLGRQANKMITAGRRLASRGSKLVKKASSRFGKTKIGGAIAKSGSRIAKAAGASRAGKALAGAGRAAFGGLARAGSALATGSGAAAGATGAGGATAVGAAVGGPIGAGVVIATTVAFVALAKAAEKLNTVMTEEAQRLEKYSGAIQIAKARGEISTMMNMMDRAQKIGPSVASVESSKNRLESQMQKFGTDILTLLSGLNVINEKGNDMLTLLVTEARKKLVDTQTAALKLAQPIAAGTPPLADDIAIQIGLANLAKQRSAIDKEQLRALAQLFGEADPTSARDPFLMQLLLDGKDH